MLNPRLYTLLEDSVAKINIPEFANDDPVQFPRQFSRLEDIEIVSLLSAIMAWGRRPMILRDCRRMLELMDYIPLEYVRSGEWQTLPDDMNIHRTIFASHLKYMLRGLQGIYKKYGTLENFYTSNVRDDTAHAPWIFGEALRLYMYQANEQTSCRECIPTQMDKTALKRINMALRWLVRDDGIVDMGVWKALKPAQLYIPLDIHVGNVSRSLGLLARRSNDRRAVEMLTEALRAFDPLDPVKYDFALFGLGVNAAINI